MTSAENSYINWTILLRRHLILKRPRGKVPVRDGVSEVQGKVYSVRTVEVQAAFKFLFILIIARSVRPGV